jgi:hypothetical protein
MRMERGPKSGPAWVAVAEPRAEPGGITMEWSVMGAGI